MNHRNLTEEQKYWIGEIQRGVQGNNDVAYTVDPEGNVYELLFRGGDIQDEFFKVGSIPRKAIPYKESLEQLVENKVLEAFPLILPQHWKYFTIL